MALSEVIIPSDGVTTLLTVDFALGYTDVTQVTCRAGTEVDGAGDPVYRTFTFLSATIVQVDGVAPAIGQNWKFKRTVVKDELTVDWEDGDAITGDNLDLAQKQAIYMAHEALDGVSRSVQTADGSEGPTITRGTSGQLLAWSGGNIIPVDVGEPGTGTAGNMFKEVYDPSNIGSDAFHSKNHKSFTTLQIATLSIPTVVMSFTTSDYSTVGAGGGADWARVATPSPARPWHKQGADGAWWMISNEIIHVRMFGAVGNWNPNTRTGTNDTVALTNAYIASGELKRECRLGFGIYYCLGELNHPTGGRFVGEHSVVSQIYLEINNTQAGGRIEASNVHVENIGHQVYLTAGLGADDGEFGSGWTLARYYSGAVPIEVSNITFLNCAMYVAAGSPFLPAHALNGIGRIRGVYVDGFHSYGNAGSTIHFHWGSDGASVGLPMVNSYHVSQIRIKNVYSETAGCVITLSAVYDVQISGIRSKNTARFLNIIPGDEANFYATAEEKPLVGSAIHISDFECHGLSLVAGSAPLRIFSLGTSRVDTDAATGLGTRRLLNWKDVVIGNGTLVGADNIARAVDLTSVTGQVTLHDINATKCGRSGVGIRTVDTRGDITLRNLSVASATGIEMARSMGVRMSNMLLTMEDRTSLVGDLTALSVDGTEYTSTLSVNKAANATQITLATATGALLYPGDKIVVGGYAETVAGTRTIRPTEVIIPIEVTPNAVTAPSTVAVDQRSVPKITRSTFNGYDYGVNMVRCRDIDVTFCDFTDIWMSGVSGVAKYGVISWNTFTRGGARRIATPAAATRNLLLSAGTDGIVVTGNQFGVGSSYIDICMQTSADTGCLRVRDNGFHAWITQPSTFATQSAPRLAALQDNKYLDNYKAAGGTVP